MGFGVVHDLAEIEIKIRRHAQVAQHSLHVAKHLLRDVQHGDESWSDESAAKLSELIEAASVQLEWIAGG